MKFRKYLTIKTKEEIKQERMKIEICEAVKEFRKRATGSSQTSDLGLYENPIKELDYKLLVSC